MKIMMTLFFLMLFCANTPLFAKTEECSLAGRLKEGIRLYLNLEQRKKASFALAIYDKNTGNLLCEDSWRGQQNVYPASSIKTLVAFTILRMIDEGKLSFEQVVTIDQSNADAECARNCRRYGIGAQNTIRRLLRDMIVISNNIATNQLIQLASKSYINQTAKELGAECLMIKRRLYVRVNPDPDIEERNHACASGMQELYREIATGRLALLKETTQIHLINLLSRQSHHHQLNTWWKDHHKFYHKTGTTSSSSSDAGFLYLADDKIVVLAGLQDFKNSQTMRQVGRHAIGLIWPRH